MSRLDEVGERDGWRCWLCDGTVDPAISVNDARGASLDRGDEPGPGGGKRAKKAVPVERLAHRACNTRKGAVTPVVPWPDHLFVVDPAPIIAGVDQLQRKGGRIVMGRCPTEEDARATADWLADRISRLRPGFEVEASVEPGAGQFLVVLR